MKNKTKIASLLLFLLIWLFLMWKLSSADGTETLRDSLWFANKIGAWIYDTPTPTQLNALNMHLRKLAHVFLYVVFGGISAMLWHLILEKFAIWKQVLPAFLCCTTIAFLDELHKIPIAGRHFDFSESVLNAGSATITIFCFFLGVWIHKKRKKYSKTG